MSVKRENKRDSYRKNVITMTILLILSLLLFTFWFFSHYYIHETGHVVFSKIAAQINEKEVQTSWVYYSVYGIPYPKTTRFSNLPDNRLENWLRAKGGALFVLLFYTVLYYAITLNSKIKKKEPLIYLFITLSFWEVLSQLVMGSDGLSLFIEHIAPVEIPFYFLIISLIFYSLYSNLNTIEKTVKKITQKISIF